MRGRGESYPIRDGIFRAFAGRDARRVLKRKETNCGGRPDQTEKKIRTFCRTIKNKKDHRRGEPANTEERGEKIAAAKSVELGPHSRGWEKKVPTLLATPEEWEGLSGKTLTTSRGQVIAGKKRKVICSCISAQGGGKTLCVTVQKGTTAEGSKGLHQRSCSKCPPGGSHRSFYGKEGRMNLFLLSSKKSRDREDCIKH